MPRNREMSATQEVVVSCPVCGEHVECLVQYGKFDGIEVPCLLECHKASHYPWPELEARAITIALVERHEYESHFSHDAAAFDRWDDR